jgi:hypothetical protein
VRPAHGHPRCGSDGRTCGCAPPPSCVV